MIAGIKKGIRLLLGIKNDTDYYGQAGEDAIVSKTFTYLLSIRKGFYIDIGSYHPFRHSNTYILYKAGWRGINIDPRPGSKALFNRYRNKDTNIEAGIAGRDGKMVYYMLDEGSTMNTFSKENLEKMGMLGQVKKTIDIPVFRLDTLLSKYPEVKEIDYMNIDAEGFEMEILSGLNFNLLTPKMISIEQNNVLTLTDVLESPVCNFLTAKGYTSYAKNILLKNVSTVFYIHKSALPV